MPVLPFVTLFTNSISNRKRYIVGMKNQLLIYILLAMAVPLKAQLGITVSSTQGRTTRWQAIPENFIVHRRAEFLRSGTSGVIDYVFPLKNDAIRLRPALQLFYANSIYYPHYFNIGMIGFQGNIEFALWGKLDKQGKRTPFRPFLQVSPGVAMASLGYDRPIDSENKQFESFKSRSFAPSLGASLFLEFKLSPLITIAPMVGMRYYHQLYWKDFTKLVSKGSLASTHDRSNMRELDLGVRVGLSFE
jgi:hypothetical protein